MGSLQGDSGKEVYFEHHPGERTVALSHGWGMGCRVWDDTTAALIDAGFGVVAYDHRCCGASDNDFADVSIEALGGDLALLCRHLRLEWPVLIGWSLGGAVVVDAAVRLGAGLAGLVLTGGATPRYTRTAGFPHGGSAEDVAAAVSALRIDRVNFLRSLYFDGVFAADVSEAVKQHCWWIALQASPAADASLGALANLDQRAAMASLDCPALVVAGEVDEVVPAEIARVAADTLTDAELVVFEGCGHAPFLEDRARYHAALLGFLGRIPSNAPKRSR